MKSLGDQDDAFDIEPCAELTWPLHKRAHFNHAFLQVGHELIRPDNVTIKDDGTWSLSGCSRGLELTKAAEHDAGSEVKFLVTPYGVNFVPDNNSELLYEVAENYAAFLNDCRVAHVEFDEP